MSSHESSTRKQEMNRLRAYTRQVEAEMTASRRALGVSCSLLAAELGQSELALTQAQALASRKQRSTTLSEGQLRSLLALEQRFTSAKGSARLDLSGEVGPELVMRVAEAAATELTALQRQLDTAHQQLAQTGTAVNELCSLHANELNNTQSRLRQYERSAAEARSQLQLAARRQQQLVALVYEERRASEEELANAREGDTQLIKDWQLGAAELARTLETSPSWPLCTPATRHAAFTPERPLSASPSCVHSTHEFGAKGATCAAVSAPSGNPTSPEMEALSRAVWRRRFLGFVVYRFLISQPMSTAMRKWESTCSLIARRSREVGAKLAGCMSLLASEKHRGVELAFRRWLVAVIDHSHSQVAKATLLGSEVRAASQDVLSPCSWRV